jgi:hypothetical protein
MKLKVYKTMILSAVLYGREDGKENTSTKDEVAGGCRRLHTEELNLYDSPIIVSKRMIRVGHVARVVWMKNAYNILVGKAEEERPQGRPRRR